MTCCSNTTPLLHSNFFSVIVMEIKCKQIRCASARRFSGYDKASKTRVYVDDLWLDGGEFHIIWNTKKFQEYGYFFLPQTDIKGIS